jgi:hypothetical protein
VVKYQAELKAETLGATTKDGRYCLAAFLISDTASKDNPNVIALGVGMDAEPLSYSEVPG